MLSTPMTQPDVKIKTVRERTSVPSQLAGIVAVVVPPLGLVAAVWLLSAATATDRE